MHVIKRINLGRKGKQTKGKMKKLGLVGGRESPSLREGTNKALMGVSGGRGKKERVFFFFYI